MKKCSRCKIEKDKSNFHNNIMKKDNLEPCCKACSAEKSASWYSKNKNALNKQRRDLHKNKKIEILTIYSNKEYPICSCNGCGITDITFLTIDHIKDGAKHKKTMDSGNNAHLYRWLIKNNYPEGFQVLCMNCNFAKRTSDCCPIHKNIPVISFNSEEVLGSRLSIAYENY